MTIYFGNRPLSKLFLGVREIIKAYKGDKEVYSNENPPSPTGDVQLVNGGKGIKLTTDYELPDGTNLPFDITIPNICGNCSLPSEEEFGGTSWQFNSALMARDDGKPGVIEYISLSDTPISLPITVFNKTWTSNSDNSNDNEGLRRSSLNRSGNTIAVGDNGPEPYLPMSSLLNKQDYVGALKISELTNNTWYTLEVAVQSLDMSYSPESVNNFQNTNVPFTIAVFDGSGSKIDINGTNGEIKDTTGKVVAIGDAGMGYLYKGTVSPHDGTMVTKVRTTFYSGSDTVFYVAVMYKGSEFTGQSTDTCLWRLGGVNLGVNEFGSRFNAPLYLNVEKEDDFGDTRIIANLATSNYGYAKYTVTVNSDGVAQLNEIN